MKNVKDLLEDKSNLSVFCGASNPLIAELAQRAGFDGVWLSSFELHAWNLLPDASILNTADYSDVISKIADRISVPILVDADEGGPSAINTIRMVREYSKAGAWGVCIEDNPCPKRCSFYGMQQQLEDSHVTVGKIKAAIDKYVIMPMCSGSSVAKIDLKPTITSRNAAPPYTRAVRALISFLSLKFIFTSMVFSNI